METMNPSKPWRPTTHLQVSGPVWKGEHSGETQSKNLDAAWLTEGSLAREGVGRGIWQGKNRHPVPANRQLVFDFSWIVSAFILEG
jgi:hypothetical protein